MSDPMVPDATSSQTGAILVVDSDILSRHNIAGYLRHCGYAVVEAANTDEALLALKEAALSIDVVLCDVGTLGTRSGFELAGWVRENRPDLEVKLAGSFEGVAEAAAELCEVGPHLGRPYDQQAVVDYVTRLRASRKRSLD